MNTNKGLDILDLALVSTVVLAVVAYIVLFVLHLTGVIA